MQYIHPQDWHRLTASFWLFDGFCKPFSMSSRDVFVCILSALVFGRCRGLLGRVLVSHVWMLGMRMCVIEGVHGFILTLVSLIARVH